MKTQVQQGSFAEARDVIEALGLALEQTCFSINLRGSSGVWWLQLMGHDGPRMPHLIKALSLRESALHAFPESGTVHHEYVAWRGRTRVELTVVEKVVRRVNGQPTDAPLF